MPSRDPSDNSVVLYLQMGKWDQTKFSIHQVYRTVIFVEEILLLRFLTFGFNNVDTQIRDPWTPSSVLVRPYISGIMSIVVRKKGTDRLVPWIPDCHLTYWRLDSNFTIFSDPIQINGIKLLGNASEASLKHLKAMERRALKLWGEATGKTIPLRMKKICMYNVSTYNLFISWFERYNCSGNII